MQRKMPKSRRESQTSSAGRRRGAAAPQRACGGRTLQRSGFWARWHYCLSPPAARPATMRRWKKSTMSTSGSVMMTPAAICEPKGVLN